MASSPGMVLRGPSSRCRNLRKEATHVGHLAFAWHQRKRIKPTSDPETLTPLRPGDWDRLNDNALGGYPGLEHAPHEITPKGAHTDALFTNALALGIILKPVEQPAPSVDGLLCSSALSGADAVAAMHDVVPERARRVKVVQQFLRWFALGEYFVLLEATAKAHSGLVKKLVSRRRPFRSLYLFSHHRFDYYLYGGSYTAHSAGIVTAFH